MVLKHFKTVLQANKSQRRRLTFPSFPSIGAGSSWKSPYLLLPPCTRAKRNPRGAQKSRMAWKHSLRKAGMLNNHSLISAFTCKQFKRKQSKKHPRYHKPSGCLLKREKNGVQPGTKVSMATVNLDPHRHYLCNISSQKDPPTSLPSKFQFSNLPFLCPKFGSGSLTICVSTLKKKFPQNHKIILKLNLDFGSLVNSKAGDGFKIVQSSYSKPVQLYLEMGSATNTSLFNIFFFSVFEMRL